MGIRIEIDDIRDLTKFELTKLSNYFLDILKKTQIPEDDQPPVELKIKQEAALGLDTIKAKVMLSKTDPAGKVESLGVIESFVGEEDGNEDIFTAPGTVVLDDTLDSEGLPWDERIHATTHTKTKTGAWKVMRGADPAFVQEIKAKLRATMDLPVPPPVSSTLPVTAVVPPPPPTLNPGAAEFGLLVGKITKAQKNKEITAVQVLLVLNSLGIESIVALSTRPDLVPSVETMIDGLLEGDDE